MTLSGGDKENQMLLLNSGIDDLNLTLRAMNKLLFSILLLCFSVAANAEVWFCEAVQTATQAISTCFIEC